MDPLHSGAEENENGRRRQSIDCLSVIDAVSDAHFSAVQNAMEVDDLDTLFAESVRIPE
jgi:hypothetical protein